MKRGRVGQLWGKSGHAKQKRCWQRQEPACLSFYRYRIVKDKEVPLSLWLPDSRRQAGRQPLGNVLSASCDNLKASPVVALV